MVLTLRALIQRVTEASVTVAGQVVGQIDSGMLVLVGVGHHDTTRDVIWLADKLVGLRVFDDERGKMNRSIQDVDGAMLIVSQFTLWGDTRKGRRPSFIDAAPPELADELYQELGTEITQRGVPVETGKFREQMQVALVNDGPVTLWIETPGR